MTSQADLKHERRRFERIDVDAKSGVYVTTPKGAKQGEVRQLGRGGFLMTTTDETHFKTEKKQSFVIVDPHEDLNIHVHATFCYFQHGCAGFEFNDLDADSAVKIGILIGKYYVSDTSLLEKHK
ncbi:MAG TPA: hypothetical protein VLA96_09445 [Terriglobales bacterium]|jgi:hypothetical protein|nr:hypothetical protein [Terriglobales bacterium]